MQIQTEGVAQLLSPKNLKEEKWKKRVGNGKKEWEIQKKSGKWKKNSGKWKKASENGVPCIRVAIPLGKKEIWVKSEE